MSKPFSGKISNAQVHDHPLTAHEIHNIYTESLSDSFDGFEGSMFIWNSIVLFKHLKPTGWSKLNPLAWWRWFRIRSYADHVRSLNPISYNEPTEEE